MDKVFSSAEETVADVADGSVIMFGGFGVTGIPFTLIKALYKKGTRNITAITNSAGGKLEDFDISLLFKNRQTGNGAIIALWEIALQFKFAWGTNSF
ncbi:CoA-transferase [Chloroflexota bacterium]